MKTCVEANLQLILAHFDSALVHPGLLGQLLRKSYFA